ncbi:MAG: flagellar M-ring protein FliF [Rhodobacteraceae bacterium]|nr:flagellar M-ring protein FliF [Paracoccaceae bacterium]
MNQVIEVWSALDLRRRVIVIAATVAVFVAILGLSRMATAPSFSLLYAGLEPGAAGDVVQALESRSVQYEVRGGAIYVEGAQRDELRMTLASEGLPANGVQGYELLDSLSGFGTTSQMFDAAYWRAKEGELARTIVSSPHVSAARVHIANGAQGPFQPSANPTASVVVTASGATFTAEQAKALKHLVAAAVPGLQPASVTVVDASGQLVSGDDQATVLPLGGDRSNGLRDRVQRLVDARVGRGNAVVEVSVETVTQTEVIRERLFDPEGRVAISTDTEERSNRDQGGETRAVTVASNLPDGETGANDGSSSQGSETRERINYEVSETMREISRAPGDIRRVSVAVLVNGATTGENAIAQADLDALRDLVASAVGFNEARGDAITIRAMPFEVIEPAGTAASPAPWLASLFDWQTLAQMVVLGLVALGLGLFVVRPLLSKQPSDGLSALPAPEDRTLQTDAMEYPEIGNALTGEIETNDELQDLPMMAASPEAMLATLDGEGSQDPVERLKGLIAERRGETVEILRSWLDDPQDAK